MEMIDFEKLTAEQKKLFILKQLINYKNNPIKGLAFEIKALLKSRCIKELLDYIGISFMSLLDEDVEEKARRKIANYDKMKFMYNRVLDKANLLAQELKLSSSLEYANLFTFLLWNGYFSEKKSFTYQSYSRSNNVALYPFDIMRGIGVCINFSMMLTDYLNKTNYSAAVLDNFFIPSITIDYSYSVEQNAVEDKTNRKLILFLLSEIIKRMGNHDVTLIDENGKLYIYDATNLCIFEIIDCYHAHIISGNGEMEIKPFISYAMSSSEKERDLLEKLISGEYTTVPYDATSFRNISEGNKSWFLDNMTLIEDFYSDVHSDIVGIASELKRVRKKTIDVK